MTVTYTNNALGETTSRNNVKDFAEAWSLSQEVCKEMNWNEDMFAEDIAVKELKL